jgi:hypothetical protein
MFAGCYGFKSHQSHRVLVPVLALAVDEGSVAQQAQCTSWLMDAPASAHAAPKSPERRHPIVAAQIEHAGFGAVQAAAAVGLYERPARELGCHGNGRKVGQYAKATAKALTILCIVNLTTKWDRGLRTVAEFRTSLFDGSAKKFGDRRRLQPQSPDAHVGWLSDRIGARRMAHTIFCWPSALQSGDLRATKSQQSPVNLRDVGGHPLPAIAFG